MPTPKKGARLGGSPAHQRLILSNLATSLFEHGRITTTEAKARQLRPLAEKLITKAKKAPLETVESLHNRRIVLKTIRDKGVVHTLFTEIAERFQERPGGYTRITKIGPRKGDNAPMAVIELVNEPYVAQTKAQTVTQAEPKPEPVVPAASQTDTVPETEEELAVEEFVEEGAPLEAQGDDAVDEESVDVVAEVDAVEEAADEAAEAEGTKQA